jgi:hypothetical protein
MVSKKTFSKSTNGEIHFGNNSPEGFDVAERADVESALKNLGQKKIWRCNVCNDLHIGKEPPKQCPTCFVMEAYVEINEKEFLEMIK